MHRYALVFLAATLGLAACKGPGPKKVGDATLALALGVEDVPAAAKDAPLVEVLPGEETTRIPDAPLVKLAIHRDVTWDRVQAVLAVMQERGQEPVLLVTQRRNVKAFHIEDAFEGPALDLIAYTNGRSCVRHPDIAEAKCVQTLSKKYIDGAFTREIVREAVRGYQMSNVEADIPEKLSWGDTVRVIDAARTCCKDTEVLVKLRSPEQEGDSETDADSDAEAAAEAAAEAETDSDSETEAAAGSETEGAAGSAAGADSEGEGGAGEGVHAAFE